MVHDNPALQKRPVHVPRRYEVDGMVLESTPEYRAPRKGEIVLGPLGPARVKRDLSTAYRILRAVEDGELDG